MNTNTSPEILIAQKIHEAVQGLNLLFVEAGKTYLIIDINHRGCVSPPAEPNPVGYWELEVNISQRL